MRLRIGVAALILFAACTDAGEDVDAGRGADPQATTTSSAAAAVDVGDAPETFFAVRDHGTELVEMETATGRIRRTVVDHGPWREPPTDGTQDTNTYISGVDLAPDGRTLWYSAGALYRNGSVFRMALPDGEPEQVADGHGPSVSPDGRRLAWIDETTIRIRDLAGGGERSLPDVVGLEGYDTTWSTDGAQLAFLSGGADAFGVAVVAVADGSPVRLRPAVEKPGVQYTPYTPKYRSSDGLLAVFCCGEVPDPPPDFRPPPPALVFHDPATGKERGRVGLSISPASHDYDTSGTQHLLTSTDGEVYLDRNGELIRIPATSEVSAVAW